SIDVDPERFPDFLSAEVVNTLLSPPRKLEEKEFVRLRVHQLGWMLSQFLHGEQGALLATAQIVNTVPWLEAKFYAASQVRDEARHVAFGVLSLEDVYRQMTASELREREDFVIEAAHLMRDRLLMQEVWERLGYDLDVWTRWSIETPFMQAFRQLLFSKIVPN